MTSIFAIVTEARTGSTWLCSALDGHPEIVCDGELFHPNYIEYHSWERGGVQNNLCKDVSALRWRDSAPDEFLASIVHQRVARGGFIYGFKHALEHSEAGQAYITANKTVRIIILTRKNSLAQFLSRQIAFQTGIWNSLDGRQMRETQKVQFRMFQFFEFMYEMDKRMYKFTSSVGGDRPILSITYEEIFTQAGQRRLLKFLCASARDLQGAPKKQGEVAAYNGFQNPMAARIFYLLWDGLMPATLESRIEIYNSIRKIKNIYMYVRILLQKKL